jgi:hypothetical protein
VHEESVGDCRVLTQAGLAQDSIQVALRASSDPCRTILRQADRKFMIPKVNMLRNRIVSSYRTITNVATNKDEKLACAV